VKGAGPETGLPLFLDRLALLKSRGFTAGAFVSFTDDNGTGELRGCLTKCRLYKRSIQGAVLTTSGGDGENPLDLGDTISTPDRQYPSVKIAYELNEGPL